MRLRPYKFIVYAIVQELDDTGAVVGEVTGMQHTKYGCAALEEWARAFPANLAIEEALAQEPASTNGATS